MKKVLIVLAVLLMAVSAMSQTGKWYYAGARVDYKPTSSWHATGGWAIPTGKNLWVIPGYDLGGFDSSGVRTSALQAEVTWMPISGPIGAVHVFLEPGVDWVSTEQSADAYLTGAVGVMGVLKASSFVKDKSSVGQFIAQHIGIWGAWKYKTDFKSTSRFPTGNSFGIGLAYKY
jgi:hypothetical protein